MELETRHAAGFVLFAERDEGLRFLLLLNSRHGTWGFPKGHCDHGEDDLACARRELLEETTVDDIVVRDGFENETRHVVRSPEGRHEKVVRYFLAEMRGGRVKISPEHSEFRWVDFEEGVATLQWDDLKDLLREALRHLKESEAR